MNAITRRDDKRRADEITFRAIYLTTLPVFLVSTTLVRLASLAAAGPARPHSLLSEAKAAARTCGSFALMG